MTPAITIDASTGNVVVNGFTITPNTTPTELPTTFALGGEIMVRALREEVPCRFARATVDDGGQEVQIELRFERDILVSMFFQQTTPSNQMRSAMAWYESGPKRERAHLKWIQEKLGPSQGSYTRYRWGDVGVAQDKSADVHVFIHNRNNRWGGAFSVL